MKQKKNNLTDSDKVFVTVALWMAFVSVFVTALTLPMLPSKVTIFYKPTDAEAKFYSKYNNLWTMLFSLIPAAVIIVTAALKKRNHMQRNFISIMMFSIVLSTTMSALTIYGIVEQLRASQSVKGFNDNSMIALTASFMLSVLSSLMPMIIHSRTFAARSARRSLKATYILYSADRYWHAGAYGFLAAGVTGAFCPGAFSYIPLVVAAVAVTVFMCVNGYIKMKHSLETVLYDALDS